jgi:ankyrin repeat protein
MLGSLPVIDSLEELAAYYAVERDEWLALETRRQARARLLEMGISCHAEALAQCSSEGDTKAVALFIEAGFNPDTRDKRGVPLLCLATRGKHLAVAELLLDRGASIDLQSEDRGYSALMDAAQAGAVELARLFLSRNADPNLASKDSQTALIVAVGRNDAAVSRLLLEAGADPDIVDKLGLSARKYAALFRNETILSLIESRSPAPKP